MCSRTRVARSFESFNARGSRRRFGSQVDFVQDNHSRPIRNVMRGNITTSGVRPQGQTCGAGRVGAFGRRGGLGSSQYVRPLGGVECRATTPASFGSARVRPRFFVLSDVGRRAVQVRTEDWFGEHERDVLCVIRLCLIRWPLGGRDRGQVRGRSTCGFAYFSIADPATGRIPCPVLLGSG